MGENPDLDNGLSLGDDLYLISNRNMHITITNFNIEHPRLALSVLIWHLFSLFQSKSSKKNVKLRPEVSVEGAQYWNLQY